MSPKKTVGKRDQIQIHLLTVFLSYMHDLVFVSDLMSLDNFWKESNEREGAVAPYSEIMKRSSGGVGGGPWRVWPGATAVLHKLTQELSRPILVPSLRHLKPPQLGDSTINYLA